MRTGGDPRSVHRASEMPEEHKELFAAEIDRLARPRGMTMSREFLPGQVICLSLSLGVATRARRMADAPGASRVHNPAAAGR
ncbi:hypothetical protein CDO26_23335 (plasmid) [Sinorhizobium meliloti]|nr:hypothetical protein CDO26_23335 [Sinorhizobium meliloti]